MRFRSQAKVSVFDVDGNRLVGTIDELIKDDSTKIIQAMWVKFDNLTLAMFAPELGGQDISRTFTLTMRCNPWK